MENIINESEKKKWFKLRMLGVFMILFILMVVVVIVIWVIFVGVYFKFFYEFLF